MLSPDTHYPLESVTKQTIFLKNFITNPNIEVGDYTYYSDTKSPENFETENVMFAFSCKLIIGKFCQIAQDSLFLLSDANHQMNGFSTYPFFIFDEPEWKKYEIHLTDKGDTHVGHDVWMGRGATLMPGVKVGNGAIIGAKSVVTKEVPPYHIVAGNPAKIIRPRYEPDVIERLQQIAWWDWSIEEISAKLPAITGHALNSL